MAREFGVATTAVAFSAVWAADRFLEPSSAGAAFIAPNSQQPGRAGFKHVQAVVGAPSEFVSQPATSACAALGATGLLAFGMGYGALMGLSRGLFRGRRAGTARRAADLEVAEKTETKPVSY
eukprot:CAMPEP_0171180868 /NCGR_PEP_ID=MMETSP0790-20130122/13974_1 /TAXON_ID=2925 /ORGANISM="Alexandrium catenella, Strain OF101" /LENGTH=121 /DNA_ID=CAMNT_0011645805 /DNA_START=10 /DNA_END=372 /DNA_ORIENTATION=-